MPGSCPHRISWNLSAVQSESQKGSCPAGAYVDSFRALIRRVRSADGRQASPYRRLGPTADLQNQSLRFLRTVHAPCAACRC